MLEKNNDFWYSEYHSEDDVKLSFKLETMLHTEQSLFQRIHLFHNETYGNILVLDGYVQVTEKDEFVYHDMIVHPAMAVNPAINAVVRRMDDEARAAADSRGPRGLGHHRTRSRVNRWP